MLFSSGGHNQNASFGQLCLIHGFLAHVDIEALCCKVPAFGQTDDVFKGRFLFAMYPLICQLCLTANFKYHSFKLLELWYRKLHSSQSHLLCTRLVSSVETCSQFDTIDHSVDGSSLVNALSDDTYASSIDIGTTVNDFFIDTLNLIIGHADCNVDGVDESISIILTTLIDMDMRSSQNRSGNFIAVSNRD
jgi:hypothetical protein